MADTPSLFDPVPDPPKPPIPPVLRDMAEWRTKMLGAAEEARAAGHPERALRLWEIAQRGTLVAPPDIPSEGYQRVMVGASREMMGPQGLFFEPLGEKPRRLREGGLAVGRWRARPFSQLPKVGPEATLSQGRLPQEKGVSLVPERIQREVRKIDEAMAKMELAELQQELKQTKLKIEMMKQRGPSGFLMGGTGKEHLHKFDTVLEGLEERAGELEEDVKLKKAEVDEIPKRPIQRKLLRGEKTPEGHFGVSRRAPGSVDWPEGRANLKHDLPPTGGGVMPSWANDRHDRTLKARKAAWRQAMARQRQARGPGLKLEGWLKFFESVPEEEMAVRTMMAVRGGGTAGFREVLRDLKGPLGRELGVDVMKITPKRWGHLLRGRPALQAVVKEVLKYKRLRALGPLGVLAALAAGALATIQSDEGSYA